MFFSGIADEAGASIHQQIRAHKSLGWDHIEVRTVDQTSLSLASDIDFDRYYGALLESGIQVSCFASALANWARDIQGDFQVDVDELRTAIPRMRKLKTPFIRVMSWTNKQETPESEWRNEAIRRMKELAKMAEDGGVTLLHENCDGWAGLCPENSLELLAEVNSPALRLVYDTGNPMAHGQGPWDFYTKVKPHVVYVHIKDRIQTETTKNFTYPGEGHGQVRRVVKDLLDSGYDGGFSIEPHIAKVIHADRDATPKEKYDSYLEYGRRLMTIVQKAKA